MNLRKMNKQRRLFLCWGLLYQLIYPLSGQTNLNVRLNQDVGGNQYTAVNRVILESGFKGSSGFKARIDGGFIPSGSTLFSVGTDLPAINTSDYTAGSISGSFTVTPQGMANYVLPLDLPQGIGGLTPNLSIVYNSTLMDGILGTGFSLGGLSVISRAPKSHIDDGYIDRINYDNNDNLILDGNLLRVYSGSSGNDGAVYLTKNFEGSKVIAHESLSSASCWFEVKTRTGLTMEYGSTYDSRITAPNSNTVAMWLLSKVSDSKGNYYTISYQRYNTTSDYWITRIDYNMSAESQYRYSVIFTYADRSGADRYYINGYPTQLSKYLTGITVYKGDISSSNQIRSYGFTYQPACLGTRLQLTTITLQAGGVKLNPIVFKWKDEDYLFQSSTESYTFDGGSQVLTGDFNGDGRSDVLTVSYDAKTLYLYLKNAGAGFSATPFTRSFSQPMVYLTGDFNGDGRTDVLLYNASNKKLYWCKANADGSLSNSEELFTLTTFTLPRLFILDNNGDGLSDVVVIDNVVYSSEYDNFNVLYSGLQNGTLRFYAVGRTPYGAIINGNPLALGDFDGDGRMDLVTDDDMTLKLYLADKDYGFRKTKTYSTSSIDPRISVFADFNGDGLTDIFSGSRIYFSKGKVGSTFDDFFQEVAVAYNGSILNDTPLGDINGDGKADIMNGYLTIGYGKFARLPIEYDESKKNVACDIDGDGVPEVLSYEVNAATGKINAHIIKYFSSSKRGQVIEGIREGLGAVTRIEYRDIVNADVYTRQTNAAYPVTDISAGMQVVYKVTTEDGTGGTRVTTYQYEGGKVHRLGRGFLGFTKVKATDSKTGIVTENTYEYDPSQYYTALKSSITRQSNGGILSSVSYSNSLKSLFGGKVFSFTPNSVTTFNYDLSGNQTAYNTTTYQYDSYGNITQINSSAGTTGSTITSFDIENTESNWWIGKVKGKTVTYTRYGVPNRVRTYSYAYNADRLLSAEISEPDDTKYRIERRYSYDSYGNLIRTTIIADGRTLVTEQKYENGPEWPSRIIDAAGNDILLTYDTKLGKVKTRVETDSTVVNYSYDPLGRQVSESTPFGVTQYAYRWASAFPDHAPTNAVFAVRTTTPSQEYLYEYYDKYGRQIRKAAPDINGNYIYTDTEYDALGRVKRKSEPYRRGSAALWTSYTYNILGQVTSTTYPDGTTATVSYNGLNVTTTNPKGQTETRSYDLLGTLVSVTDNAGGVIRYGYDAMGNMTSVTDPAGNITTMSYDIYGNRTVLNDKNLGKVTDDYNALGQLVSSTNAKGYTTSYTYDNLGRVLTRTEWDAQTGANVVTSYVYDGTYKYTRGKIISESNGTHSRTYTYNNKGLLTSIAETIDNTTYRTRYSYDDYGRVTDMFYPGGFRVKHTYRNGYVHQVTSAGGDTTYYTCNDMTARGQVSSYRLGANLTVAHTYDAATGFLTQTTAGSIQDMRYQYDVLGNLTRRTNQKRNLYEDFTYDGLNRLTSSTVYNNGVQSRSVVVQYNNIGNITFKSDVGTYQYDAARPHAVVRIVNPLEDYQPLDYDVEYTSFDKVYRISNATQNVTFTYGVDHQRIKVVNYKDGQTTTKYYVGKLYEKEILPDGEVKENFYIFANGEAVAIYTRSTNSANRRLAYCLRDHLGSLMYLVSPAGVLLEEYAYDPWGRRRDPLTWKPLSGIAPTARGFTGHEHIDLFELVNMDGRVYDPRLGRFLSPDPYVQDPTYSQSLNRYSYCVNNPLVFYDPSGYTWLSRAWKWLKKFWQPSVVFGLYGGLKYDEGKQKGYSDSEAWLYAGVQTAITAIAAYAGTYVGAKVSAMLPFGGFWGGFVTGSAGAYASIFINYFGINLLSGKSIWDSYWLAQRNAHIGAIVSGIIGGIVSGLGAYFDEQKRMADENLDLMGPEMNDEQLVNHAKTLDIEPGQNGLNKLSTEKVPRGYTFNESTRLYVDPAGNPVYGVTQRSFWTGKANIYISPYATRNEMLLNATLIHENAHVLQYYTGIAKAWGYDKILMERNALVHELNYYNGLNRTNSLLWRYFRDNTLKHLLKLNY